HTRFSRDWSSDVCSSDLGRTAIADRTGDFAYLRCKNAQDAEPAGYPSGELERIAAQCRAWERGEAPSGLSYAGERDASAGRPGEGRKSGGEGRGGGRGGG